MVKCKFLGFYEPFGNLVWFGGLAVFWVRIGNDMSTIGAFALGDFNKGSWPL
jgi:hypothetical protein